MKTQNIRGFGLVELMISLALGLVILAAAYTVLQLSLNSTADLRNRNRLQQNGQTINTILTRDFRMAGSTGYRNLQSIGTSFNRTYPIGEGENIIPFQDTDNTLPGLIALNRTNGAAWLGDATLNSGELIYLIQYAKPTLQIKSITSPTTVIEDITFQSIQAEPNSNYSGIIALSAPNHFVLINLEQNNLFTYYFPEELYTHNCLRPSREPQCPNASRPSKNPTESNSIYIRNSELLEWTSKAYFLGTLNGVTGLYMTHLQANGTISSAELISSEITELRVRAGQYNCTNKTYFISTDPAQLKTANIVYLDFTLRDATLGINQTFSSASQIRGRSCL